MIAERKPAALILGGGMALGAYQLGVLEALEDAGLFDFTVVAGSSIGAIAAAILAGNAKEERLLRLREFWDRIATDNAAMALFDPLQWSTNQRVQHLRSWRSSVATRLLGAPGVFTHRIPADTRFATPSLYDSTPLARTLEALIDFDRLNSGETRLVIGTTELATAHAHFFDTAAGDRITIAHLLASGALLPNFPAVEVDGRLLGDGGFTVNVPLEPLLASDRNGDIPEHVLAIDLFPGGIDPPTTIEQATEASNDLKFAGQTLMRVAAIERERRLEVRLDPAGAERTQLFLMGYRSSPCENGPEKPFDLSRATLAIRRARGREDAAKLPAVVESAGHKDELGLHVWRAG